jgi:hypothetical protein
LDRVKQEATNFTTGFRQAVAHTKEDILNLHETTVQKLPPSLTTTFEPLDYDSTSVAGMAGYFVGKTGTTVFDIPLMVHADYVDQVRESTDLIERGLKSEDDFKKDIAIQYGQSLLSVSLLKTGEIAGFAGDLTVNVIEQAFDETPNDWAKILSSSAQISLGSALLGKVASNFTPGSPKRQQYTLESAAPTGSIDVYQPSKNGMHDMDNRIFHSEGRSGDMPNVSSSLLSAETEILSELKMIGENGTDPQRWEMQKLVEYIFEKTEGKPIEGALAREARKALGDRAYLLNSINAGIKEQRIKVNTEQRYEQWSAPYQKSDNTTVPKATAVRSTPEKIANGTERFLRRVGFYD